MNKHPSPTGTVHWFLWYHKHSMKWRGFALMMCYFQCRHFFLPTDLVVFWGNKSLSKSSLSIPVPSELLSAFICRNKEPIFCSPWLRLSPDDTRTTVAKRKKTSLFRLQHNKASNYSKLLAILIKTRYINWSSTTKDKCINANLMAPVFSQVCLNKRKKIQSTRMRMHMAIKFNAEPCHSDNLVLRIGQK